MKSTQYFLTPAAGKKLIAKAVVKRPDVQEALRSGTIFVIGGTTNVYVANALLEETGSDPCVNFPAFHRGVALPPGAKLQVCEQLGDLVIEKGVPHFSAPQDLPEVCRTLKAGDIIFKGANALNLSNRTAAILLGNAETGGTIMEATRAVTARRAKLILPVGVEKRVDTDLDALESLVNDPEASGLRLFRAPGEAFCELDAIRLLTGCEATIIASGAVNGGEGGVYLQIVGEAQEKLRELLSDVRNEPPVLC